MSSYHISVKENQTGPFDEKEIQTKVRNREISASDSCWKEGMEDWRPISEVITLQSNPPVPPTPPSSTDSKLKKRSILEGIILFLTAAVTLFLGFLLHATRTSLLPVVQDIHEDKFSHASIEFYHTPHLFNYLALAAIVPIGLGLLGCFRQLPRNLSALVVWLVLSLAALYTMIVMYAFITPLS